MRLRRVMILVVFWVLGCDSSLPLGSNDGGPPASEGGVESGARDSSPVSSSDDSGQPSGPAPSAACLGAMASFGCTEADGSVDPPTCESDCEATAAGCHVDSFTATADCTTLCSGCDTQAQVACLQSTSCSALVTALNGQGTLCGFPNAGGASVDPACCAQVCEHAARVGCNVGESTANAECVALCSSSPNWSQLNCVLAVPCSALLGALEGPGSVCGI
jgi:hypothetical protein